DVADDDRPVVPRTLEHVVEIPADVASVTSRLVVCSDLDTGNGRQVRWEQAPLERPGQLSEAGAAHTQLALRLRAVDKLPELRADGVHHVEQIGIGLPDLRGEELHHAEHVAPAADGNREPAVQPVFAGNPRSRATEI